jgi:hypothetical protein
LIDLKDLQHHVIDQCDWGRLPRYCNEIHSPFVTRIFGASGERRVAGIRPVAEHKQLGNFAGVTSELPHFRPAGFCQRESAHPRKASATLIVASRFFRVHRPIPSALCPRQFGAATPREAASVASARFAFLFITQAADTIAFVILAASNAKTEALIVAISCKAA